MIANIDEPETGLIAITGATGFIGKYLVNGLKQAGYPVRAIARSGAEGCYPIGDLAESPQWNKCLEGVDTVIHCAALTDLVTKGNGTNKENWRHRLYRINRDAVAELAKACIENNVRRIIFLSSAKVYGESSTGYRPFSETDKPSPKDDYGESKRQAEDLLRSLSSNNLQICALRLPLVYGPGVKGNFLRLQRLATSGLPLPLASIRNRRSLLGLNNLLTAIKCLLGKSSWPFFAINVADKKAVSTPEIVRALACSKKIRLLPIPMGVMWFISTVLGKRDDFERLAGCLEISTNLLSQLITPVVLASTEYCIQEIFGEV